MELSHYWKMRVSFGIEHLGEPLSNVDWLWRDCPILLPPSARNDVIIRRQYLHVPLKEALDDILGSCSYRCFPWCGCIYVVNSDEAPGAEPRLWPQEIWRGDGDGAEYLEKALAQRINTGVSKPGPALYTSISKVAPQVEHKLSFDETAKLTHYKGVPAGKMSLGHFLALLERFDEVKTIAGEGWFTLYRGDEPAGKAAAEEKLAQRTVRVGVEIPEYYFETPSFSELPQDRMEKLRKMDASDRLDRTISIAFDNLRLDKALRKLEAIAYFHFSTADDTKELTTSTNVIGYFDQKRVQTVISELCAKCGLKWKLRGKKPPEGEPDTRFMIDLRISGRRPAIGR
ncbi:MAG: hypothetical protein U5N86_11835 [Planctomycetota bacterium]|nr:hypothetical protein [Planctomycetota bacterium]